MSDPLLPPTPALAALFADERAADAEPAGARAEIRARLGRTLAIGALAAGATAATSASTSAAAATTGAGAAATTAGGIVSGVGGKLVVLLVSVGIAGAGGALVASRGSASPTTAVASKAACPTTIVDPRPAPTTTTAAAIPPPPIDLPRAKPIPTPTVARPTRTPAPVAETPVVVTTEPQLLARAWASLEANDAAAALALVAQDRDTYPDGALAEERAAVEILALARMARFTDARRDALAFAARYPTSLHQRAIDRALEQGPVTP